VLPPLQFEQTISTIVREDWGRILASLVGTLNDWQLAEDVLQDAVEQAMVTWQNDGLPDSPAAWLITTARRKAIDHFRRAVKFKELQPEISYLIELQNTTGAVDIDQVIPDKRLELIFTCCHPALDEKTQVALTLRTLGGLKTEEIAQAFLDKPATMAQRLSRAKQKIAAAGIPFEVPIESKLNQRLSAALSVIYLIFNEGYSASTGKSVTRADLSEEAIRLCRIVQQLLPDKAEAAGLLALMLLHDSRRFSRTNNRNNMVSLEYQNRHGWDKSKILEGTTLLKATLRKQQLGAYQLQAAISAVHAESESWDATDWIQINALYELLYQMQPSAVIRVNQAMAKSYAVSVDAALGLLDEIKSDKSMRSYQPFFAARADLYFRNNNMVAAAIDFKKAITLSDNEANKAFLQSRLSEI